MKLGEVLRSKGYNLTAAMSATSLVASWSKLPTPIKNKFAAITAAVAALKLATDALLSARKAYETAHKVYDKASNTMNTALQAIVPGPGQAVATAKVTTDVQQVVTKEASDATAQVSKAVNVAILNTEVEDSDLPLFDTV